MDQDSLHFNPMNRPQDDKGSTTTNSDTLEDNLDKTT